MSPRRPEGFWGAIAVTLGIGAALSLPLALILIVTVHILPAAHWTEWIQTPSSIALAALAFLPISLIIEPLSAAIATNLFNSHHTSLITTGTGALLWFLFISLLIQPTSAALFATVLYTAASYLLDKLFPR